MGVRFGLVNCWRNASLRRDEALDSCAAFGRNAQAAEETRDVEVGCQAVRRDVRVRTDALQSGAWSMPGFGDR